MTFQQSVITCFRKYFTFSGRAARSEYWWFVLFNFLGAFVASLTESVINGMSGTPNGPTLLSGAFNLATFIPSLAVGWRRMHDTGRSGLYLLYPLIAMVGLSIFIGLFGGDFATTGDFEALTPAFALLVILAGLVILISPFLVLWWLTRPSQSGPNQYGPNPHEVLK
jgi:uncharacterized membrane protein YhaH (DUF805 family)